MNKKIKLFISISICLLAAIIGSVFTTPSIPGWYKTLNKPSFSPPNWIFGPVWTILFILMGISLYLIWTDDKNNNAKKAPFIIFILQLLVNIFWSVAFFTIHSPGLALSVIAVLWLLILSTIISFRKISKLSAYLLIPYLFWVSFASILNFSIWKLNP